MPSVVLVQLPNGHYALDNDKIYNIPLVDKDASGNIVPMPSGDVVSVATSGPFASSLNAVLDANGTSVDVAALVVESDAGNSGGGIGLVLTDSSGLSEDSASKGLMFDIVVPAPGPAVTEGFDLGNVTFTQGTVSTRPGP